MNCGTEDKNDPPVVVVKDSTILLLSPKTGQSYKTTDAIQFITRADYSKFASGVNLKVTVDSGKHYELITSRGRKAGIAQDTLNWTPETDSPGLLAPGMVVRFLADDYNKRFGDTTGQITISN